MENKRLKTLKGEAAGEKRAMLNQGSLGGKGRQGKQGEQGEEEQGKNIKANQRSNKKSKLPI
jgi:hypothetical protein